MLSAIFRLRSVVHHVMLVSFALHC